MSMEIELNKWIELMGWCPSQCYYYFMDGVKDYLGLTLRLESGDSAILLSDEDGEGISTPVIVHELIHAVSHVLRNVGIEYSLDSEEVYAYVMEDLTEKVTNWISSL